MQHILIIEEQPESTRIGHDLEQAGYQTTIAQSGLNGLIQVREINPHLIILDLSISDFDAAEIARRIRKTTEIPIIVITTKNITDCRINLESVACDYITKPFTNDQIIEKVTYQLEYIQKSELICIGKLKIFPNKRIAQYNEQELYLSPTEFDILVILAQEAGKVYSRNEIEQALWSTHHYKVSNVVNVHIANIRAKLRDFEGYGIIRTVRGVGYSLRLP